MAVNSTTFSGKQVEVYIASEDTVGTFDDTSHWGSNYRLDVEDNIGEGIHIHYRNLRFDFTIKDFIELAKACDKSLKELYGK